MSIRVALAGVRGRIYRSAHSAANLASAVMEYSAYSGENMSEQALHATQARRVIALAYLGLITAWEEFLEQSFVRYVAGGHAPSGYNPRLRLSPAASLKHSYQLISGRADYDPESHHLSWSRPREVIDRARIFFEDGRPYSVLRDYNELLEDANSIRNRVAHSSAECRARFKRVALKRRTNPPIKTLPAGFKVGDLLLLRTVNGFPHNVRGDTYLQSYLSLFLHLVDVIVPERSPTVVHQGLSEA